MHLKVVPSVLSCLALRKAIGTSSLWQVAGPQHNDKRVLIYYPTLLGMA